MNNKKFVLNYLKYRIKIILLYVLSLTILLIVFFLYRVPFEPAFYGLSLCAFTGIIAGAIDFIKSYKNYSAFFQIKKRILQIPAPEQLPKPNSINEWQQSEIIKLLHDDKKRLTEETENAKRDMAEYYTMWVHQIKTPIAAMNLLLQTDKDCDKALLSSELFKIEQYVEMVLSYIRLKSDSSDLVIKEYSLDAIIKQALRKYSTLFIRKKLSLNFKESGITVLTDEKWLLFVIEQILSNALKYTPSGSISIYTEETGKILVIEDTGIGIAPDDLPRVFERGFTGYNGRTDKKSTGIGLYLCKNILNKLSHTITIESKVANGTKVNIDFSTVDILID